MSIAGFPLRQWLIGLSGLLSGMTLHTMGESQAWLPVAAVAVAAAAGTAAPLRRRSQSPA